MNKITKVILLLLLFPGVVFSQNEEIHLSKKEIRKARPAYIGISLGINSSNFRDFATSPLFYSGWPIYIDGSWQRMDDKRESQMGVSYSFGNYSNFYNDHSASSKVKSVLIYYSQLYKISKLSCPKMNVKVGGLVNFSGNLRINSSLQNNAAGYEFIPTLLGSIKVIKDISRTEVKSKKFLFIKYKLKKRIRSLAFRLNLGIVNSSYRNGYAYIGQSAVLNDTKVFDAYQFNMFSGFRMSTALDYTVSLKNKNKLRLSYLWDAYKTGGDLDKFEMASHTLSFTFLFNTNNK